LSHSNAVLLETEIVLLETEIVTFLDISMFMTVGPPLGPGSVALSSEVKFLPMLLFAGIETCTGTSTNAFGSNLIILGKERNMLPLPVAEILRTEDVFESDSIFQKNDFVEPESIFTLIGPATCLSAKILPELITITPDKNRKKTTTARIYTSVMPIHLFNICY